MTPLGFEGSDGLQNLTEAFLALGLVAPGIYVSMHGQLFPVGGVRKDHQLARFVSTEGPEHPQSPDTLKPKSPSAPHPRDIFRFEAIKHFTH
jgi:hypothetical protein